MPTDAGIRPLLDHLIAKWRGNAEVLYRASASPQESVAAEACMVEGAGTLAMCADELEAVLRRGGQALVN